MANDTRRPRRIFAFWAGVVSLAAFLLSTAALCRPARPTLVYAGLPFEAPRKWHVFTQDLDGAPATQVTNHNFGELGPAWAPDGTRIAYGRWDVLIIQELRGGGMTVVPLDGLLYPDELDWSPDGARLAFHAAGPTGTHVYTFDIASGALSQLTAGAGWTGQYPSWSPTGDRIVYTSFEDVYTMDADGGNQRQLTDTPGTEIGPAWSPDGSEIAYAQDHGQILVMRADGAKQRAITQFADISVRTTGLSWPAESDLLLFSTLLQDRGRISTIRPNGEDLKVVMEKEGFIFLHVRLFTPSLGLDPRGMAYLTLGDIKQVGGGHRRVNDAPRP